MGGRVYVKSHDIGLNIFIEINYPGQKFAKNGLSLVKL
jgi:hypothetical protein